MRHARGEQSRVTSVDPGSGSTVELSKEEKNEAERNVFNEVAVGTHSTGQRSIVATLVGTEDAGLKALRDNVGGQVRVEASEEGRVDKRSLE